jgi:BirA family transcriptional regulator, biotin operon repressor / biotin---[acetyl-CoA-carboxylase] ligase
VSPEAHAPGQPQRLPATPLGHPRVHLRETDSTNARARELALAGAPQGTLVTASFQTAGRGRQGRRWVAPAGRALLMSLVLRGGPDWLGLVPLAAAVAVCDAVGSEARIKWPNDVVVIREPDQAAAQEPQGDRAATAPILAKLAGILTEGRPQEGWGVLGIGLNVAVRTRDLPGELRLSAASMGRSPEEIEPTLEALVAALQGRLAAPKHELLDGWRERDALYGREIEWGPGGPDESPEGLPSAELSGGRGRAEGIDDAGRLLVALPGGGRRALNAGEVRLQKLG